MNIRFDPRSTVIKLCMSGMNAEDNKDFEGAAVLFQKALDASADDYEKFIAAFYFARVQSSTEEKLKWMRISLQCAQNIDDDDVKSAYSTLYFNIAKCYDELGDLKSAKLNYELSESCKGSPSDKGPFYHGTKADLRPGDLLVAGGTSNYKPDLKMNHIYFTANLNGAGLAAALAKGEGREHVYIIEPTGKFENDPNVTDKKFPGNLTRSYRSEEPLKIIGEVTDFRNLTEEERHKWQQNIDKSKGEIIN